jgi:SAM-dependent methyltransferase
MHEELLKIDGREIVRTISPRERIFVHSLGYFLDGKRALEVIRSALATVPETCSPPTIRRILDLPCGHGRELRYLRAGFPDAEIVACDLDRDAVDFCAQYLGAVPIHSSEDPRDIKIEGKFDLIWCGSLFTHCDAPVWDAFLDLFESHLSDRGCLIFTFQGRRVADYMRRHNDHFGLTPDGARVLFDGYERSGFGYHDYPRQTNYGISLSAPSWVCARLESRPALRLLSLTEMGWSSAQDVVSCIARSVEGVQVDLEGCEV